MSVLIRGMEMPKNCRDCPCFCEELFYCHAKEGDDIGLGNRPKDCPLFTVPPHGDLIDYDFCMENYELLRDDDGNPVYAVRMRDINNAPTIIQAEEGE